MPERRPAFTKLELIVVLVICVVLAVLIFPLIQRAREKSRLVRCRNNLRQLGIAFLQHAEQEPYGRFSSGIPNLKWDGCPYETGWVADVLARSPENKNHLLCGANELEQGEVLAQMMEHRAGDELYWSQWDENGQPFDTCHNLAAQGEPNSKVRAAFLEETFLKAGHRTNYAASWYFARTTVKTKTIRDPCDDSYSEAVVASTIGLEGGLGPLSLAAADNADAPMSNLPLLGDAAKSMATLKAHPKSERHADGNLARIMNHGPAYWNHKENRIYLLEEFGTEQQPAGLGQDTFETGFNILWRLQSDLIPAPNDSTLTRQQILQNPATWNQYYGGSDQLLWQQDTTAWAPVHNGQMNMLMADGSVKLFTDINGDGFLNPGFPKITTYPTVPDFEKLEEFVDLPDYHCFNRALLSLDVVAKGCF